MADTRTFKDALQELAVAISQKLAGKADAPGVGNYITDVNAEAQFAPKAGTGEGEAYATEGYVGEQITNLDLANTYQAKGDYAPAAAENETYAYQSYVDTAVNDKANSDDVYAKTEVYTKAEVDEAITNAVPTQAEIEAIVQEYLNNQNSGE